MHSHFLWRREDGQSPRYHYNDTFYVLMIFIPSDFCPLFFTIFFLWCRFMLKSKIYQPGCSAHSSSSIHSFPLRTVPFFLQKQPSMHPRLKRKKGNKTSSFYLLKINEKVMFFWGAVRKYCTLYFNSLVMVWLALQSKPFPEIMK